MVPMINSAYKWLPTRGTGYCNFFYWLLKYETHRHVKEYNLRQSQETAKHITTIYFPHSKKAHNHPASLLFSGAIIEPMGGWGSVWTHTLYDPFQSAECERHLSNHLSDQHLTPLNVRPQHRQNSHTFLGSIQLQITCCCYYHNTYYSSAL